MNFKQKLETDLERIFPKGKCKERGEALVLFAMAIVHNLEVLTAERGEIITELMKEMETMKLEHDYFYNKRSAVQTLADLQERLNK